MKLDRKLDDSYRVLIPIEIRRKLDINKYEPFELNFNEETKEITVNFKKYNNIKVDEKLPNPVTIEPLESNSIRLQVRKKNLITIPSSVFKELNLKEKRYDVSCSTRLNESVFKFTLAKDGTYKYRKENVVSFSEINKWFESNICEGVFCNFKYKSDGTLMFIFNPIEIQKKISTISVEERLNELNTKFANDGLCKEEYDELNKLAKELEPPIKQEKIIEDVNIIGPDLEEVKVETPKWIIDPNPRDNLLEELESDPDLKEAFESEEYRRSLPKFKKTDIIEQKYLIDDIIAQPCPRCGNIVIGNKTLKINGKLHCELCSKDFKTQLLNDLKKKNNNL